MTHDEHPDDHPDDHAVDARLTRRRSQSGGALIAMLLMVVLFTSVTLAALTSNTLTGSAINGAQTRSARQLRAVDNALETAINGIRMDPEGLVGAVDSCPSPTDYTSNDNTITVSATCEESLKTMPADTNQNATAPSVKLVGADGYRATNTVGTAFDETVLWKNDCARGNTTASSCAPWSLGLGLPNYQAHKASVVDVATPSFVHSSALRDPGSGAATLGFASDVFVRRSSATMVDPSGAKPAVQVAGRYQQGESGLFTAQGGGTCGIAGPSHPWNVTAARIADADDDEGAPECGTTVAETANDRLQLGQLPSVPSALGTSPSCPAGATDVAVLRPGRYDKARTAALNRLFGGQCPGRTFWFQPESTSAAGVYWFDVEDPTNPDGSAKSRDLWNSLIISDPTVRIIFGTPAGGYTATAAGAAKFPNACDNAAYGVEVVLSPRTTLRQLDGKVAICDRDANVATNSSPAAIWQAGAADGGWRGTPDPAVSTAVLSFRTTGQICLPWIGCFPLASGTATFLNGSANRGWIVDGSSAQARFSCTAAFGGACIGDVNFQGRGIGQTSSAAPSPGSVTSLDVIATGTATERDTLWAIYNDGAIGSEIKLYLPGSATALCGSFFPYSPDSMISGRHVTLAYDLLSTESDPIAGLLPCRSVQIDRQQLRGAGVDLKVSAYRSVPIYNTVHIGLELDGFELRAGWDLSPTAATSPGWSDPTNLLPSASGAVSDGAHSGFSLQCVPGFLGFDVTCPTDTRTVTVSGFDNTRDPHVPVSGTLQAAGIVITGNTSDRAWFTGRGLYDVDRSPTVDRYSTISVTISNLRGSAGSCTANWPKVPFWGQGLYLNLLDSTVAGTCSTVLTNAEQLIGATAAVTVYLRINDAPVWCASASSCDYFGVRVDSVRLSTVTSGDYTRPRAPMLMTIGNDSATGPSTFNVFGQVSMPRNDLTIRWNGPSPRVDGGTNDGDPVPIGGGNMILAGLGSFVDADGEAGIICCSPTKPAERIVDLVARRQGDATVVGTARIRVSDLNGPGAGLAIEDWSIGS